MPTAKPRVNVTMDPDTYAALKRCAELQSVSMSSLIGEIAEMVAPYYSHLADEIERVNALEAEQKRQVLASFDAFERDMNGLIEGMLDQVPDPEQAEKLRGLWGRSADADSDAQRGAPIRPRSSNTGATFGD